MNVCKKMIGGLLGCLLLVSAFAVQMRADDQDLATKVTFRQPIGVPGNKVLAAGTYWFVALNVGDSTRIVRIFNADRTKVIASMVTNTTERLNATDDTEFIVSEPSQDQPAMLLSWFYPGHLSGHQFVYDKDKEKIISQEARVTVLAAPSGEASGD